MARVAVVTFTRAVKGTFPIAVDLGGETPVAVILLTTTHDPANGTAGTAVTTPDHPNFGIGMATVSSAIMNHMIQQDNNSVQGSQTRLDNNTLYFTGTTFSQDWEVTLSAVAADEVTLNFLNAPITNGYTMQGTLIVFGGSDCQAQLENINLGTGTTAIDVTAPGFEPDIVFAAHAARSADGASSTGGGAGLFSFGIGLNDGADTQRAIGRRDGSGTLTVNRQNFVVLDNRIAVFLNGGVAPTLGAQVTIGSYDASGYSVTPSASHSSILMATLAIKAPGIDFHLDDFLTRATTGVESYGGMSFQPEILFVLGGGSTAINTASGPNAENATSYMSATQDGGDSGMYLLTSQFNVDPSNTLNYSTDDGSLISLGDPTVDGIMAGEIDSFTSDGFDLNYTTVNGTQYVFMGLAMTTGGAGGAVDSTPSGLIFTVM